MGLGNFVVKYDAAGTPYLVQSGKPFELKFKGGVTGVDEDRGSPQEFSVSNNYPNPFNPSTTITFHVGKISPVSLKVYDALGREVTTLANGLMAPGDYSVVFNAMGLSSGVYYCTFIAGGVKKTVMMTVAK